MPEKGQSILLGGAAVGIAAAIVNLIPTVGGCISCLLYIAAGIVAVWHYTDRHQLTITGGQGAGIGALAGIVAGVAAGVLGYVFQLIGIAPDWRTAMEQGFDQSGMDPAQMEQMLEWMSSPLFMIGIILVSLIVAAILGAIGGAIGSSLFKRGTGGVESI